MKTILKYLMNSIWIFEWNINNDLKIINITFLFDFIVNIEFVFFIFLNKFNFKFLFIKKNI